MVKMKKGDRGRQAWHDTVSQLARETGAAVPGNSPQKRRETRKRVAKQTKAASRWIDDAGLDARDLTAWARVDAMLDAPKTSHLIALDADDSDGGEYREDSHSDVDMDEDERRAARRAKKKDAPKKSRERKAPTKRKKKRNPEEERRRQRHRQRVLSQVLLGVAYLIQVSEALTQVALDNGIWAKGMHMIPAQDPLTAENFGGDPYELD